jgi:hypothetical protein
MPTVEEWSERLSRLTCERLARECRARLVLKDSKGACKCIVRLLERSGDEAQLAEHTGLMARALSGMHHDRERIQKILQSLSRVGGKTVQAAPRLIDQYTRMVREAGVGQFEDSNQAWVREIADNALVFREYLPYANATGQPDEADIRRFSDEVNVLLRAAGLRKDKDDLLDALMILLEYCPVDESEVNNLAGVEERMFIQLGPRARLTAVRTMRQLGEIESLRKVIVKLSEGVFEKGSERTRLLVGIMGGLGHRDFCPTLCSLLKHCGSRIEEAYILDALGRSTHPKAAEQVLGRIVGLMKKPGEKWFHDRLDMHLTALSRYLRRRDLDVRQRVKMVGQMVSTGRNAGRHVAFLIAEKLFGNRPEELDKGDVEWAACACVEAIWGKPFQDISLFRGLANGWRQPMVDSLLRLGRGSLETILEAASKYKAQFSGAMAALANVLDEIGDESAVSLIDTMIRCALMHDDAEDRNDPFSEKVSDAGTGELQELDRDDVIDTMIRVLVKIGGDEGLICALDIADQMQAGRVRLPGQKTVSFLMDLKIKHGKAGEVTRRAKVVELDEKSFKSAISEARGGLMIRKNKQIAAIAALGSTRRLDGVQVFLEVLNDKDLMITAAAHNALTGYVNPLPDEAEFGHFLDAVLEKPAGLKGRRLENLLEFIRNEIPKNKPYDRIFARQLDTNLEDGPLAHQLKSAAKKIEPDENQGSEEDLTGDSQASSFKVGMSELDRKRTFMQARQEWIKNGKKGDPPKMSQK